MKVDITNALNRCPLCGKTPKYWAYDRYDGYFGECEDHYIKCPSCEIMVLGDTACSVLNKWNRLRVKV